MVEVIAAIILMGSLPTANHLEYEGSVLGRSDTRDFDFVMAKALLPDPVRTAQMLVTNPREEAVYLKVIRNVGETDDTCRIVHNRMKEPLGKTMQHLRAISIGGNDRMAILDSDKRVPIETLVDRTEVAAPRGICETLRLIWWTALSGAISPTASDLIVAGDDLFHFAAFVPGAGYATASSWAPEKGTLVKSMVDISLLLINYAHAGVDERSPLEEKIRSEISKARVILPKQ
jgi:hypothetical protein